MVDHPRSLPLPTDAMGLACAGHSCPAPRRHGQRASLSRHARAWRAVARQRATHRPSARRAARARGSSPARRRVEGAQARRQARRLRPIGVPGGWPARVRGRILGRNQRHSRGYIRRALQRVRWETGSIGCRLRPIRWRMVDLATPCPGLLGAGLAAAEPLGREVAPRPRLGLEARSSPAGARTTRLADSRRVVACLMIPA